jgi:UrcA family protein
MRSARTFAALCAGLWTATAVATPPDANFVTQSKAVKYVDADLATPRGVAALYARLGAVAREVCAHQAAPQSYSDACARDALDHAVARVNSPALAELHRAHSPRVVAAEGSGPPTGPS